MARENTAGTGVMYHYGPRTTNEKLGGLINAGGRNKQAVYKFTYDDLPRGTTDGSAIEVPIGAIIREITWKTTTAFAGGTSYDVGLESSAQSALDADGVFDALLLTDIDATPPATAFLLSSLHAGTNSGLVIGQHLLVAQQLMVVATGTFTAGAATVTIEYMV